MHLRVVVYLLVLIVASALIVSAQTITPPYNGSGGGGGATTATQLTDCQVTRTSATVLTIGATSSASFPCIVRVGSTSYKITSPATLTVSANSGTAYVYVTSGGVLTAGYGGGTFASGNVVCSGCTAVFGVTAFPSDSLPLSTWTATSGAWDSMGGSDERAVYSVGKKFIQGSNITLTETPTQITIAASAGGCSVSGTANTIVYDTGAGGCANSEVKTSTNILYPTTDSTTAIRFAASNGSTILADIDSTNRQWLFRKDSLGTTPSGGVLLYNSTAAAAGAQQISPPALWCGQGWKTNATAASQETCVRVDMLPVQGTTNPTWSMYWDRCVSATNQCSTSGGTWTNMMSLVDDGASLATLSITGAFVLAGTSPLRWNGRIYLDSTQSGVLRIRDGGAAAGLGLKSGTTSSDVFLKFSGTDLQIKLGDDSAFSSIQAKHKSSDGTAGVTVTTCTSFKDGLCVAGT